MKAKITRLCGITNKGFLGMDFFFGARLSQPQEPFMH